MTVRIINADVFAGLAQLVDESVHCCVTSPPYWGLRDYGVEGQIGREPTLEAFVAVMVAVFREVRRVLRTDGTLWLNLGDSYASSGGSGWQGKNGQRADRRFTAPNFKGNSAAAADCKPKDLVGIPWMVAFALRSDGWYLRQEIIWAKPNPMPESVTDRRTKAHEHIFLLSKSERYFYDAEAIREGATYSGPNSPSSQQSPYGQGFTRRAEEMKRIGSKGNANGFRGGSYVGGQPGKRTETGNVASETLSRNKRSVWTIATQPYPDAHFATFPEALPETCIKAGCPVGGMVLDPFGGAGTTGLVADKLGRNAILIELNAEYAAMAERRIRGDCPMFAEVRS